MPELRFTALERVPMPRPVERIDYVVTKVADKLVFDLGALDETAYRLKQDADRWLHARIAKVAARVVGFDNSALVPPEGLITAPNAAIYNIDIFDLGAAVREYGRPDVIVGGELIEHLPDTSALLRGIAAEKTLANVPLIFTTPNAANWHNGIIGTFGRESMHPDHLQIYSYKTLRTLFERSGLTVTAITPYHVRFDEMVGSTRGPAKAAARVFQGVTRFLEWMSPARSAGLIIEAHA